MSSAVDGRSSRRDSPRPPGRPQPADLAALLEDLEAARLAVVDAGDPCCEPGCECCARWTVALTLLRESARVHLAGELRIAPCHPECLLCASIEWQGTPAAVLPPAPFSGPANGAG